jgi:predicted dehydrogenase
MITVVEKMKVRLAQFGISHDHAAGKARVLIESDQVEFCGVYEPDVEIRETLGADPAYEGVRWIEDKAEILDDTTIAGIAAEGRVSQNLAVAREALEHGKHVWLDKPAGDNLEELRAVLAIAREKGLLVQ